MVLKHYSTFFVFAIQYLCLAQFAIFDDVPSSDPPNFESDISFNSFPKTTVKHQPELSAATEIPGNSVKQNSNFPYDFSQPAATEGTSPASSFKTHQPSLETFVSSFTNAVHTSTVLSNLFDLSNTSVQSFENFVYHDMLALSKSLGMSNPAEVAAHISQPLTKNFEILTYPMLLSINANAMGKNLLAEGILNETNAASLALEFAKAMELSAKKSVQKNYPMSKFRALSDGYIGFLKSQDLCTAEKFHDSGRYFGEEVKLSGERFGLRATL